MENSEHLQWIHDRIVNVYNESFDADFLIKLREIIEYEANVEENFKKFLKFREEREKTLEEIKNKPFPSLPKPEKKEWIPPFRVGRKQKRAVLDSKGIELVVFPVGAEHLAEQYCELMNKEWTYEI